MQLWALGVRLLNWWSRASLWRLHCGSPGFLCSSAKKRTITSTTVCVCVTAARVCCDACMLVSLKPWGISAFLNLKLVASRCMFRSISVLVRWTLSVFLLHLLSDSVKLVCVRALRIEDSFKKLCACTGYQANHSTPAFRLWELASEMSWQSICTNKLPFLSLG